MNQTLSQSPTEPYGLAGVRIFGPNATVAQDLEPEYATLSDNEKIAYVSLQEANAMAIVDVIAARVLDILPLGYKDHDIAGNALDPSDRDGGINIRNWPVFGMYQPDEIKAFKHSGEDYVVMANEGDSRDFGDAFNEEVRVGSGAYPLDPATFPNAAALKLPAALGRLTVTNTMRKNAAGNFTAIFPFGARSFTIRRGSDMSIVYDR